VFLSIFASLNTKDKYEVVIGMEVHAQLLTNTKIFCGDSAAFGAPPNTQVSPISLAHPGTLPKMNVQAMAYAVKLGLALHCDIETHNYFARKNYFYPDLPKGYQVTQHTAPVCRNGRVKILTATGEKDIPLNRIHMEEDAGKSIHDIDPAYTCIDLNRAGVPLLEIVSEPALRSAEEAYAYLTELRKMVRWLGVCDGNMEEGSLRCDANVSVRLKGDPQLGTRVEVKNLNSIRNVKRAIEIESARLIHMTAHNEPVIQETRSYDADNNTTFSLRSKEEADDYRYFPEPDLPPFFISEKYIAAIAATLPPLPETLTKKYTETFLLSAYDAAMLVSDKETADLYETLTGHTKHYKAAANWIQGPLKSYCNEQGIAMDTFPVTPPLLAGLIDLAESGMVNFNNAAAKILPAMISSGKSAYDTALSLNLLQENDTAAIEQWVHEALAAMPDKVKEYKSGKKGLQGLFAGEVKKLSKGKADMQVVNKLLSEKLNQ
jgi:aspartyl-tRNA(Asn)/glutamyl-tRNA(Gln) amidotransferase subunit B